MEQGVYTINKEVLKEIENNFIFDFPVNFKEFNTVTMHMDVLEFYKESQYEEVWTDKDREYIETPAQIIYYKRNSVSGCYCRV